MQDEEDDSSEEQQEDDDIVSCLDIEEDHMGEIED